jgi:hypothetical protein
VKVQVDGSFVNLAVQPDLDRDLFANVKKRFENRTRRSSFSSNRRKICLKSTFHAVSVGRATGKLLADCFRTKHGCRLLPTATGMKRRKLVATS